jgi:hypothetical protein
MKQLIIITNTLTALFLLSGCGSSKVVAPSQNSALNNISKSSAAKEKKGAMQNTLDNWLHDTWEPTVSKDPEIQKKYMKKVEKTSTKEKSHNSDSQNISKTNYVEKEDKPFTLQEYVDKAKAYMKAKPNDYEHSNVKKVESLPVIGK